MMDFTINKAEGRMNWMPLLQFLGLGILAALIQSIAIDASEALQMLSILIDIQWVSIFAKIINNLNYTLIIGIIGLYYKNDSKIKRDLKKFYRNTLIISYKIKNFFKKKSK